MNTIKPEDLEDILVALIDDNVTVIKCPTCNGTGTIFKGTRSIKCPECNGLRKLVLVPRSPLRLPMTKEWANYLNAGKK